MPAAKAEQIANRIKELPPLPLVVQKLLQVVGDEKSSAKDLTQALEADQALTGKVLKLVNSSFYGFSGKISTLSRAVVILGYSAIRNLAMGLAAYDALKKMKSTIDWNLFWSHSITCAGGSLGVAKRLKYSDPEEAFIAGLLHDLGFFVLSLVCPDEFKQFMTSDYRRDLERENELFGANHAEIGMRLLEHWKLPESLCRVARFHHSSKHTTSEEEPLISIVRLADIIASVKGNFFIEIAAKEMVAESLGTAGLSIADCTKLLAEIDRHVENTRAFLQVADGDGTLHSSDLKGNEIATVAVVSSVKERQEWMQALLQSFGHHVVAASTLSPDAQDRQTVNLAILDAMGLKEEPMVKLAFLLRSKNIPVAILHEDTEHELDVPADLLGFPEISFFFTQADIARFLKGTV